MLPEMSDAPGNFLNGLVNLVVAIALDHRRDVRADERILRFTIIPFTFNSENRNASGHCFGGGQTERVVARDKCIGINRGVHRPDIIEAAEKMDSACNTALFAFPVQLISQWAIAANHAMPTLGQAFNYRKKI